MESRMVRTRTSPGPGSPTAPSIILKCDSWSLPDGRSASSIRRLGRSVMGHLRTGLYDEMGSLSNADVAVDARCRGAARPDSQPIVRDDSRPVLRCHPDNRCAAPLRARSFSVWSLTNKRLLGYNLHIAFCQTNS